MIQERQEINSARRRAPRACGEDQAAPEATLRAGIRVRLRCRGSTPRTRPARRPRANARSRDRDSAGPRAVGSEPRAPTGTSTGWSPATRCNPTARWSGPRWDPRVPHRPAHNNRTPCRTHHSHKRVRRNRTMPRPGGARIRVLAAGGRQSAENARSTSSEPGLGYSIARKSRATQGMKL